MSYILYTYDLALPVIAAGMGKIPAVDIQITVCTGWS